MDYHVTIKLCVLLEGAELSRVTNISNVSLKVLKGVPAISGCGLREDIWHNVNLLHTNLNDEREGHRHGFIQDFRLGEERVNQMS